MRKKENFVIKKGEDEKIKQNEYSHKKELIIIMAEWVWV